MILGLLPWFRRCNSASAIASIICGVITFALLKITGQASLAVEIASPMLCSLLVYVLSGLIRRDKVPARVDKLLDSLQYDDVKEITDESSK